MPAITIHIADPASNEAQACIDAYISELQTRFTEGFDPANSVSANPHELTPPNGWFILARQDGHPVGCGALKAQPDGTGEIKRMWVAHSVRNQGIATRLLNYLETLAAQAGIDTLRLDTHRDLTQARAFYKRSGYAEIDAYNGNPYAHHWFEKRGIRQLYADKPAGDAS